LTVRMALGSFIIKEKLGLTDMETVEQIKESPYLQYFIGQESYEYKAPFDASTMTYFRKRFKYVDLSPLEWEHLNFTGDYIWSQRQSTKTEAFNPYKDSGFLSMLFFPFRELVLSTGVQRGRENFESHDSKSGKISIVKIRRTCFRTLEA